MTMADTMTAAHRPLRPHIGLPLVPVLRLIELRTGHYDGSPRRRIGPNGLATSRDLTSLPDPRRLSPMILPSLLSRGESDGEPGRPDRRRGPARPRSRCWACAAWCGTLAGLLEVATVVARKRFFDTNQLLGMSRHFVWLVPLTDLLLLLLVGLVGCLVVIVRPGGWPLGGRAGAVRPHRAAHAAGGLPAGLRPGLAARGPGSIGPPGPRPGAARCRLPARRPLQRPDARRGAGGPRGAAVGGRSGAASARAGAADPDGRPQRPPDRDGHRRRRSPGPLRLRPPDQPRDRRAGPARLPVRRRACRPLRGPSPRTRACSPGDGPTSCRSAGGPRSTRPRRRSPSSSARAATPRRASSPTRRTARRLGAGPRLHASIATTSSASSRRSGWRCWSRGPSTGCRRSATYSGDGPRPRLAAGRRARASASGSRPTARRPRRSIASSSTGWRTAPSPSGRSSPS